MDDREFLASYDPRSFDPVAVTVDVVTLTIRDGELDVLIVRSPASKNATVASAKSSAMIERLLFMTKSSSEASRVRSRRLHRQR